MIDFHSHILPEMDDGSTSVDESLQMLKLSFAMGIDTIVLTPHYYADFETIDSFLERRNEKQQLLLLELEGKTDVPNIVVGAEVSFFSGMSREKEITQLCIENTKFMLLEMPFSEWTSLTVNEIKNLIINRGITPIIAHIERYLPYQRENRRIEELLVLGAIFQANGEAVTESNKSRSILKMIDKNIIQLLGSDCHNLSERSPNLEQAFQIISKKLGNSVLRKIDFNGRRILNDEWI